jgi:hypothetical protein
MPLPPCQCFWQQEQVDNFVLLKCFFRYQQHISEKCICLLFFYIQNSCNFYSRSQQDCHAKSSPSLSLSLSTEIQLDVSFCMYCMWRESEGEKLCRLEFSLIVVFCSSFQSVRTSATLSPCRNSTLYTSHSPLRVVNSKSFSLRRSINSLSHRMPVSVLRNERTHGATATSLVLPLVLWWKNKFLYLLKTTLPFNSTFNYLFSCVLDHQKAFSKWTKKLKLPKGA